METFRCENCNEAEFETAAQLRGHQMKCRPKDIQEIQASREERIPFGSPTKRFNCPDDDRYHYHVFNDNWRKEPGRIQRAKKAGYEVVDHEITGMSVGTNKDGTEIKAVLMRIPKELYDQDQGLKDRKLDEIEKQINRGKFDEKLTQSYGGVNVQTKLTG